MKVRQRRGIQHRPPGTFQPPFQNVRLRVHAGSMGVEGIRRIGIIDFLVVNQSPLSRYGDGRCE
jgi:hypothetical protein